MIVRAGAEAFVCISQHDHAALSGWLAAAWAADIMPQQPSVRSSLLLAASLHDVGWVAIDAAPTWNATQDRPYSFQDEPLERKLPQYTAGLNAAAELDPLAGLLCSRHYLSFFPAASLHGLEQAAVDFVQAEQQRQEKLRKQLSWGRIELDDDQIEFALGLLKLWDHISLFALINTPGASKQAERSWYRQGFPATRLLVNQAPVSIMPRWIDSTTIGLDPFPLGNSLPCAVPYRKVSKQAIEQLGYPAAYRAAVPGLQGITFRPA